MKNLKLKAALVAVAMGAGLGMSNVASADSGTCELFKQRCDAGILFFCTQYSWQCPENGDPEDF